MPSTRNGVPVRLFPPQIDIETGQFIYCAVQQQGYGHGVYRLPNVSAQEFDMSILRRPTRASKGVAGQLLPLKALPANPGALTADLYLPEDLQRGAPLVVVLHGCTQTATDYASAAGWLELADRHGFGVLMPQQQRSNNANLCFNWFESSDIGRGQGEVASIKEMIDWSVTTHAFDAGQIYISGLSAGAAMAGAMLATYPETFAGGGLIAGLPYGMATTMPGAFQQMQNGPRSNPSALSAKVLRAADHDGPWPSISIWHGDADRTVNSVNGTATVAQWRAVHGLSDAVATIEEGKGHRRTRWEHAESGGRVEHVELRGMGHGTPIRTGGSESVGHAAPYVLDVGLSSSVELLDFWGIAAAPAVAKPSNLPVPARRLEPVGARRLRPTTPPPLREQGVEKIINDALRAAGLMK